MADLARLDELLDGAGHVLDRHVGVDAVLVEQVDDVGAQPPQRAVDRGADVLGPAADAALVAVVVEGEAELRRDDDLVADRRESLPDDLLVLERSVDLGRVEERDAVVDRLAQEGDHGRPLRRRAEALADTHAAEADGGDREVASERACGHRWPSLRFGDPCHDRSKVARYGRCTVRLEPLYRIRFTYPESWMVTLEGGWEQHLFLAEGRCEGSITGRFRGANFPQRRTVEGCAKITLT